MLDAGIIGKSESPYRSPIRIVGKPDGSLIITIDFRKINDITIKDAYSVPNTWLLILDLAKSRYFTKLDYKNGYFQIKLEPESQKYTAFAFENGLYEFKTMAMGLTNAVATFQRAMDDMCKEFVGKFLVVYVDDNVIHSKTLAEHVDHVQQVINKMSRNGYQLNPDKCEFIQDEIEFVGHVISYNSVKPTQKKVEA
jgi:putative transposase